MTINNGFDLTKYIEGPKGVFTPIKTNNQPRQILYKNKSSIQREAVQVTGGTHCFAQRIEVKPMSVNAAWEGRRVKTDEYKAYEQGVLSMLLENNIPEPPYRITLIFGVSNPASDIDNPVKLFIDILQKKYKFNDKEIYEMLVKKVIVGKRREYCEFTLQHIEI